ncbi:hypothetical protein CDAR_590661 [Caerostris darwini]|uniref:Uncharacterized protein n=1 Tax=Caerostris darwini TaxID=1538125 RepID=A0AAV4UCK1_9ARAC|nr:hypothetical protein CDAR_590661 [Caerostris darwini]
MSQYVEIVQYSSVLPRDLSAESRLFFCGGRERFRHTIIKAYLPLNLDFSLALISLRCRNFIFFSFLSTLGVLIVQNPSPSRLVCVPFADGTDGTRERSDLVIETSVLEGFGSNLPEALRWSLSQRRELDGDNVLF